LEARQRARNQQRHRGEAEPDKPIGREQLLGAIRSRLDDLAEASMR
jgi:hypothetical protein